MGNAVATLSPIQSAEITRQLKIEYEKCIAEGLDSEAATAALTKKYENVLKHVQASPLDIITSNSKKLKRGTSKAAENGKPAIKKRNSMDGNPKQANRLKSFEEKPEKTKKQVDKAQTPQQLGVSESAPALLSDEKKKADPSGTADSWDSVKGQPACLLCGMVFQSVEKLNTHTKYSSLHASNLKKLEEKSNVDAESKDEDESSAEPSARCRVMYTGSKFFWRSKDTIDIHLYLHVQEKCIEVIGYNTDAAVELPRLYLDEDHAVAAVGHDAIQMKVDARKQTENIDNMAGKTHVLKLIFEEEKRLLIASMLIGRLQLDIVTSDGMQSKGLLLATNVTGEPLVCLPAKPDGLIPVRIKRRRHSSSDEIKASMRSLSDMQHDLRTLTTNAEKLVEKINAGVSAFMTGGKQSAASQDDISEAKKRWRFAIQKIIIRNDVANTTEHLRKFGEKYIPADFGANN